MLVSASGAVLAACSAGPALAADSIGSERDIDRRAAAIVAKMTQDERFQLLSGGVGFANPLVHIAKPEGSLGTSGFIRGIPRLGIPSLHETDGTLGVANRGNKRPGDVATQLPSGLAIGATFDPELARAAGMVLGAEARAKGFNVVLGGMAQLIREPRGGRNFESPGEDPLLVGRISGAMIAGTQSQRVAATTKHLAVNVQETGRSVQNAVIDPDALRESDMLAFGIAIEEGRPAAIMAAYNRINGQWSTESSLLADVVKGEWGYRGWIMSDWGATHSAAPSALAGLDQESGHEFDEQQWFGKPLREAVAAGVAPQARIDDMNHRIIRSLIATGVYDDPPRPGGSIDWEAHAAITERIEQAGIVLLKNEGGCLPLPRIGTVLLVGGHADKGVLSGGGSAQVAPKGGIAYREKVGTGLVADASEMIYTPSVPLEAFTAEMPGLRFAFDDGSDIARVTTAAQAADFAIVFAVKPSAEALDSPDLDLPFGQNDLIAAVAAANRRTTVVLETGNAVLMPWLDQVRSVVAAWFPGQRGAQALAAIVSGRVSPSGRTPISWPASLGELPRPVLPGWSPDVGVDLAVGKRPQPFDIHYTEGSDVGYRWYERSNRKPLFPFGHGLTYSKFRYSDLAVETDRGRLQVSVTIENRGRRSATEVPQVYAAAPGRTHRLVGWERVTLAPGQKRKARIKADGRVLASRFKGKWQLIPGDYGIFVGPSAGMPLLASVLKAHDAAKLALLQR
ncbi:beta-glucosidase [Phenylobacterium montanum]|uniref:Glycoside hydrolase family 3 protein n=1 Tax=Phenylobacterium montanum TaxID=2823693 RepID=A0A975IWV4_9CAUL|nr:glycoside hydrolase family 3 protein [Caulobacter sp. S6]QUD90240.1 glycoside hydrolase family 3 protein [Caulobacter sp. S6]